MKRSVILLICLVLLLTGCDPERMEATPTSPSATAATTEGTTPVPPETPPAPTVPTAIATEPATNPTRPSSRPTVPTRPTEPASKPTEPTSKPTEPTSKPTEPATKPTQPATKPTEPATKPTQPATKPTEPATKPTEPATKPTQPATKPTQPPETVPTAPDSIDISYEPIVVNPGSTFTGLRSLAPVEFTIRDPENTRGISTKRDSFSFGAAKNGKPHQITVDNQSRFDSLSYSALAWDNKSGGKILYLTFDCGYEYGTLTSDILDILKAKDVPAAFFCTQSYLESAPEVVARMIEEGHIVGNHSVTHPDCTEISRTQLGKELLGVHNYLLTNFGYEAEYFRFPTGAYSPNTLELVESVGYKSVFWSIAHADWDPENQPGEEVSFETVTSRLHPGAVILLHSTSPDNVAILNRFINYAWEQGYTFVSLDDYIYWN